MSDEVRVLTQEETDAIMQKFDRESNIRQFTGIPNYIINGLLCAFALYIFWVTLIGNVPEQARRTIFLGSLVFLGFLLFPIRKGDTKKVNYIPWYDILLAVVGASAFYYYAINNEVILLRAVLLTQQDIWIGVIGILILAELCRRVVGLPILIVAGGFVAYAFIAGFSLRRVVHQLFYTLDGVIGTPTGVCSTFIVIFIFLAVFLEKSGIANYFIDLANSVAGWASGGPAKVAVIASAFEGMISGSSVANTVGSGSVTIPTMKKNGYKPEFAAAVEAAASTGGQIMPPIMGAAAFLMAELTGIPYVVIAVSAIVPSVLYFFGIFLGVHFEAKKLGLRGLPKEQMPNLFKLLLAKGYLFLPIVVLIVFLGVGGFTPAYAACLAVLTSFIVSLFRKETRFTPPKLLEALAGGSRNTISVATACAVAGIIVGVVSLTGLGQTLIGLLTQVVNAPIFLKTGTSLLVALILTMVSCLILGMGVPTTANYVIMATITAPMVIRAGMELGIEVPILAAHMFVFYFGILADITPPVALACFAGAAIAKSDPLKTGITATKLAIVAFLIPYVFIFRPEMLLINASVVPIIISIITVSVGMFGIAVGLSGYFLKPLNRWWRIGGIAGGFGLIHPSIFTDIFGYGVIALLVIVQIIEQRRDKALAKA